MSESISVSLKVVDEFSTSLKAFENAFNSASSAAIEAVQNISDQLDDLNNSIDELNTVLSGGFGNNAFDSLVVDLATVAGGLAAVLTFTQQAQAGLAALAGTTVAVVITFQVGWEIGTWLNDNVLIPIQKWFADRDRNEVSRLVKEYLDPTEALDEINAIYRRMGDDVEKFAALGVSSFEMLRSRALSEVEQMRTGIEKLRFDPRTFNEAGEDRLRQLQLELSQGEKLLEYLDKHRTAIHELAGENNSLTASYERLSKSVLDAATGFKGMSAEQLRGEVAGFEAAADRFRQTISSLTGNSKTFFAGEWLERKDFEEKLLRVSQKADIARDKLRGLGYTLDENFNLIKENADDTGEKLEEVRRKTVTVYNKFKDYEDIPPIISDIGDAFADLPAQIQQHFDEWEIVPEDVEFITFGNLADETPKAFLDIGDEAAKSFSDGFKGALKSLDDIGKALSDGLAGAFTTGIQSSLINALVAPTTISKATESFESLWSKALEKIDTKLSSIFGDRLGGIFSSAFGALVPAFGASLSGLINKGLNWAAGKVGSFLKNAFGGRMGEDEWVAKSTESNLKRFGLTMTAEMQSALDKAMADFGKDMKIDRPHVTAAFTHPETIAAVISGAEEWGKTFQDKLATMIGEGIGNLQNIKGMSEFEAFDAMAENFEAAIAAALEAGKPLEQELANLMIQARNLGVEIEVSGEKFTSALNEMFNATEIDVEALKNLRVLAEQVGVDIESAFTDAFGTMADQAMQDLLNGSDEAILKLEDIARAAMEAGYDIETAFEEAIANTQVQIAEISASITGLLFDIDDARRRKVDLEKDRRGAQQAMRDYYDENPSGTIEAWDLIRGAQNKDSKLGDYITLKEERQILKEVEDPELKELVRQSIAAENAVTLAQQQIDELKEQRKNSASQRNTLKHNLPKMRERIVELEKSYEEFGKKGFDKLHDDMKILIDVIENLPVPESGKKGRQHGGPVYGRQTYSVGEAGPEFVMSNSALNRYGLEFMSAVNSGRYQPQQTSVVVSEQQQPVINVNIQADNPEGFRAWMRRGGAKEVAEMVERARAFGGARSVGGM